MENSNSSLRQQLKQLARDERKTTAQIVEMIREVESRRLYLEWGYNSLFAFLTQELQYSAAAAQRRIEAARLLKEVPELKIHLQTGALNLSQVGVVAQSLKEAAKQGKPASAEIKRSLLEQVKEQTTQQTALLSAQVLDIAPHLDEKLRSQQDGSPIFW